MKKATGKQHFASLIARITLILLFLLNMGVFAGIFCITLFPSSELPNVIDKFKEFAMWSLTSGNTITSWGIVMLTLVCYTLVMNIIVIVGIKRSSYTIGKKNSLLKYFSPMIVTTIILMIISLINKEGLIDIGSSSSLLYKSVDIAQNPSITDLFSKDGPATIVWFVVFGIFVIAAIGFVFDFIIFMFRVLFSKTISKKTVVIKTATIQQKKVN